MAACAVCSAASTAYAPNAFVLETNVYWAADQDIELWVRSSEPVELVRDPSSSAFTRVETPDDVLLDRRELRRTFFRVRSFPDCARALADAPCAAVLPEECFSEEELTCRHGLLSWSCGRLLLHDAEVMPYRCPFGCVEGDPPEPAVWGERLTSTSGCVACHSVDGRPGPGPSFAGLFGSTRVFEDGTTAVADASYLRRSILEPSHQIVRGYDELRMPAYRLSSLQLDALVAYLASLADASPRN